MKKQQQHNWHVLIGAVACLALILGIVFVGGRALKRNNNLRIARGSHPIRIAFVNEDNGVTYRHVHYNLGKAYIQGIGHPRGERIVAVPRDVAESGLKNNSFQLAVFVPTNFSARIVDVDNPNPHKVKVQYIINAKSAGEKVRCKEVAQQIVTGLNQKLVTIYDMGILSNLYDAQQRVAGIYSRQGRLAQNYDSQLAAPIAAFSQEFPDISGGLRQLAQTNQATQSQFAQLERAQTAAQANQMQAMQSQLGKVMQQQQADQQNAAKLAQQAFQSNNQQIKQQLLPMMQQMTAQDQQLQQTLQQPTNAGQLLTTFDHYTQAYDQLCQQLITNINNQKKQDDTMGKQLQNEVQQHYAPGLTVGNFLKKEDPTLYKQLMAQAQDVSTVQSLEDQLPYTSLPKSVTQHLPAGDVQKMQTAIQQIKTANSQMKDAGLTVKFNGNEGAQQAFSRAVADSKHQHPQQQAVTTTLAVTGTKNMKNSELAVQVPTQCQVVGTQGLQARGGNHYQVTDPQNVHLKLRYNPTKVNGSDQVKLTYHHMQDDPAKVTVLDGTQVTGGTQPNTDNKQNNQQSSDSSHSQQNNDHANNQPTQNVQVKTHTQTVSNDQDRAMTVSFNLAQLPQVASTKQLAKIDGQWLSAYQDAATVAQARAKQADQGAIHKMMNENMGKNLQQFLQKESQQNDQLLDQELTTLQQRDQTVKKNQRKYEKRLGGMGKNSQQLLEQVNQQLQQLQQMQDNLNKKADTTVPAASTQAPAGDDGGAGASAPKQAADLAQATDNTANQAGNDAQAFNGAYDGLNGLSQEIALVQANGKGLKGRSMNLQQAFRHDLARSGNFEQAFMQVLDAAYQNGVPNSKLMHFIANPVAGDGDVELSGHTQQYNMGLWTIIMAVVAWFIAYAGETLRFLAAGKYFSAWQTRLSERSRKLIFITGASLISGGVIALVAGPQFPLVGANRLPWLLSGVMLVVTLALIADALLRYGGMGGTALGIAALINLIINQAQLVHGGILAHLNCLALVGHQLLNVVLMNTSDVVLGLLCMVMVSIGLGCVLLWGPESGWHRRAVTK